MIHVAVFGYFYLIKKIEMWIYLNFLPRYGGIYHDHDHDQVGHMLLPSPQIPCAHRPCACSSPAHLFIFKYEVGSNHSSRGFGSSLLRLITWAPLSSPLSHSILSGRPGSLNLGLKPTFSHKFCSCIIVI